MTVIDAVKDSGSEIKEDITASLQGALEAVNVKKHEKLMQTQLQLKQLQEQLDGEEEKTSGRNGCDFNGSFSSSI